DFHTFGLGGFHSEDHHDAYPHPYGYECDPTTLEGFLDPATYAARFREEVVLSRSRRNS
ncbi:unnamed protein product, partial [Amoebophrya sp. A25]